MHLLFPLYNITVQFHLALWVKPRLIEKSIAEHAEKTLSALRKNAAKIEIKKCLKTTKNQFEFLSALAYPSALCDTYR
jgi:hypothetical protein